MWVLTQSKPFATKYPFKKRKKKNLLLTTPVSLLQRVGILKIYGFDLKPIKKGYSYLDAKQHIYS